MTLRSQKRHAFTIVELLIVISITGILIGVVLIGVRSMRLKAQDTQRKSDGVSISSAIKSYVAQKGGQYPTSNGNSTPECITNTTDTGKLLIKNGLFDANNFPHDKYNPANLCYIKYSHEKGTPNYEISVPLMSDPSKKFVFSKEGSTISPNTPCYTAKRLDGENTGDEFGYAITSANNYTIIGEYMASPNNKTYSGSVYIYDTGGNLIKRLDGENTRDRFGLRITSANNHIMIGANYAGPNDSGSVYIYDINDLNAAPVRLDGEKSNDEFGSAITSANNHIMIGAYLASPNGISRAGSVYIYDMNDLNAAPVRLDGEKADDYFGNTITSANNRIMIGAPFADPTYSKTNAGSVYIYDTNYTLIKRLDGEKASDDFGYKITSVSDRIMIGAFTASPNSKTEAGSVYIYDMNDLNAAPVRLDGEKAGDNFGRYTITSVSDHIIIGSPYADPNGKTNAGSVYIYDINNLNTPPVRLDGEKASDYFGIYTITSVNDHIIIGAQYASPNGTSGAGSAYIYDINHLDATPVRLDGEKAGDYFGSSITSVNNHIIIGAKGTDTNEKTNAGSIYIYPICQ